MQKNQIIWRSFEWYTEIYSPPDLLAEAKAKVQGQGQGQGQGQVPGGVAAGVEGRGSRAHPGVVRDSRGSATDDSSDSDRMPEYHKPNWDQFGSLNFSKAT